jgi:ABC-type multidrug transport system permease subunit
MARFLPRWAEVVELTRHRTLAFVRQPEAVFWVFAFPPVLAAVLGFAFQGGEPDPSIIGVVEASGAGAGPSSTLDPAAPAEAAAASWVARLEADERVQVRRFATRAEADRALRGGHVDALVLSVAPPELRLDPVRPEAEVARLRVLVALGASDPERLAIHELTERGSRYVDFLFPGLLGMSVMGTGLWSIGFAVADMRQRKVLKRMLVTPMRHSSFLASFVLSRMMFLAAELILIVGFGVWVLDVPLRATLLSFTVLCAVGAFCFAAIGLLAVARVRTIEGISGVLNVVMLPMWIGSGVFFSYERFPEAIQPLLRALPLTALNDALRAAMIDGAELGQAAPELTIMLIWTVLPFFLALRIFRWA